MQNAKQNVVVSLFNVESQAYQAFSEVKKQENNKEVVIAQAALIKKVNGSLQVEEVFDPTGDAVAKGGLIGAIVGILGGPLGVLLGGSLGALFGSDVSIAKTIGEAGMIEAVAQKLNNGDVAIVALVEEASEQPLDQLFSKFETTVLRWDAETVREEVVDAIETQEGLAEQARAALRAKKSAERKAEFQQKVEELKENVTSAFDKLKAKL